MLPTGGTSEGYGTRPTAEDTYFDTGRIFEGHDQNAHLFHMPDHLWGGLPSHGATATVPMAAAPPENIPWDLQNPQSLGLWACEGHPSSIYQRLQPNDPNRYQYHQPGLLSQQAGIRCGVISNENGRGWWRSGGRGRA